MRTPGHDEELAIGFCLSEGHPGRRRPGCRTTWPRTPSRWTRPGFDPAGLKRSFYTTSSCGVCGKGALEAIAVEAPRGRERPHRRRQPSSRRCPSGCARDRRPSPPPAGCTRPGSSTARGELLCLREDVGRHNAMDKVVGWAHGASGCCRSRDVLCVSGRLSFELVQKAAVAGLPAARRRRRTVLAGGRSRRRPRRSRCAASSATGGSTSTRSRGASRRNRRPARRRGEPSFRIAEGARAVLDGETLAERAWRMLGEAFDRCASRSARPRTRCRCRSRSRTTASTSARRSRWARRRAAARADRAGRRRARSTCRT